MQNVALVDAQVTLLEQLDPAGVPISVLLGTVGANGLAAPTLWMDPVSRANLNPT